MAGKEVAMWKHNILIMIFVSLITACGEPSIPSPFHAIDVTWQHNHADFHLADFNGKPRSLADFNGKVVVLFFGYTHCPEVCPTTLADLAQLMRQLGKDSERVQVLFITLDPERDRPELLAQYVPAFDHSFLGLYGDSQATDLAAKEFGVSYAKQFNKSGGYTLDHSDGIYLIGIKGHPILLSPYKQRTDFLLQDIKMLLAIGR
jgi:protein SCO1/2